MDKLSQTKVLPLLPLRDVVIFPQVVTPLFVGRPKSIAALEAAMAADKEIILVAQRSADEQEPKRGELYQVGTLSTILQLVSLPDGTLKVLVEGNFRAVIKSFDESGDYLRAEAEPLPFEPVNESAVEAMIRTLRSQASDFVKVSKKVSPDMLSAIQGVDELERLVDILVGHMPMSLADKQLILETVSLEERAKYLMGFIENQLELTQVEKRLREGVKKQMEKTQREYYFNEQIKAMQRELGEMDDEASEVEQLHNKIKQSGMSPEANEKVLSELGKFKMMSPMSAEASVVRSYIDWVVSMPWKKRSRIRTDLDRAAEVLEANHHGLEEVKERILEYLAVQKRVRKIKGSILCLVGPPGVGKTSLGESIAKATNRKFVRMSLGGVRDEAEIRGHRRTYIGSLPGKVLQKMAKIKVRNPLFLFDEVDKMGMDHRGDPASALLEVLDPEQNNSFNDHYLEVDYDLSDVMFVCTANSMNIPLPLLDRMEIIRLPGYTEDEKLAIAKRYLVPRQMERNGLRKREAEFTEEALLLLIHFYTREAGVRSLEREIAKIFRKVVRRQNGKEAKKQVEITPDLVEELAGVRKFKYGETDGQNRIGQATGLAWTNTGGELLTIEAAAVAGKGRIIKTGSLGDVMQESIQAALTVVRNRAASLGIAVEFHKQQDIHIHVPEGATPKDGPSAGIGMCTAVVSVLTGIPVRADVAMTGEITLRGEVLSIGGLKEKLLAARRGGIRQVIIPADNVPDLKEVPDNIKENLNIKPVQWIDEVLAAVLTKEPTPLLKSSAENEKKSPESERVGQLPTH